MEIKFRLKKVFILMVLSLLTSPSALAVEGEIDFRLVNPVLKAILDPVLEQDDLLASGSFKFDEEFSSLELEKIKYDLTSTLKNVPWRPAGSAGVQASVRYQAERMLHHTGISVATSIEVKTDVLALLRHAGKVALTQVDEPADEFGASGRRLLGRLTKATNFQEIYSILDASHKLAQERVKLDLENRKEELRQVLQSKVGLYDRYFESKQRQVSRLNSKIEELRRLLDAVLQSRVTLTDSLEIVFTIVNPRDLIPRRKSFKIQVAGLMIHAQSVQVRSEAFLPVQVVDLDRLKSDLRASLVGLQNDDPAEKESVSQRLRDGIKAFKKAIREQVKASEPPAT